MSKKHKWKAGEFYDPNVLLKKARLRVDEAAALLDVHNDTVRRWILESKLDAIRLPSGQFRIRTELVRRYL